MTSVPVAIVSGALANKPFNGGNAWSRLSWILGFQKLGFEAYFVEQIDRTHCVDATGAPADFRSSVNLAYFSDTMEQHGLSDFSILLCDDDAEAFGVPVRQLAARARSGSLLFNISGHLTCPQIKDSSTRRIYYDDDPGFTQFWFEAGHDRARIEGHDAYFTIGENIGRPDCAIPTGGLPWRHTRPPVVLEAWPARRQPGFDRFTTVASWRGPYGAVQNGGITYGLKVHEFRKFMDMPHRSRKPFEIALQIHAADGKDSEALRAHGWQLVDPRKAAASPGLFQHYIRNSGAEFSVAQGIYVDTNSGWFSDRTVRYLASGRPALIQDTGFSRHIPTGQGLLAFRTLEQALDGAERITRDYRTHCVAARRLAEEFFASDQVIGRILEEIGWERP
jgi:hypothetical protein